MIDEINPNEPIILDSVKFAIDQIKKGSSFEDIYGMLLEKNIEPNLASFALLLIDNMQIAAFQKAGKRKMFFGLLWFIGGSIFSILSYSAAASSPYGGRYIVTWGAILYGAYLFLKGLSLSKKKSSWFGMIEQINNDSSPDHKKSILNNNNENLELPNSKKNVILDDDIEALINQRRELSHLKKIYNCPKCGVSITDANYICPNCGEQLSE